MKALLNALYAAALCGLVGCTGGIAARESQSEPKTIRPEQARDHAGQLCEVTMPVRSSKNARRHRLIYLDSEEDFRDEKNLGILIDEAATETFQENGIEDPSRHYRGKTIRVTGKVFLRDDRPYITVDEPAQISLVTAESSQPAQ